MVRKNLYRAVLGQWRLPALLSRVSLLFGMLALAPVWPTAGQAEETRFIEREHLVIDLIAGVEWMRCSIGQRWNGAGCDGEILKITVPQTDQAMQQANEQLGGEWRLPTRKELQGLLCETCEGLKTDLSIFPDTYAGPYWTSEKNFLAPRHQWTVNFFTGHSFGRFFPEQEMAVRLVRDLPEL